MSSKISSDKSSPEVRGPANENEQIEDEASGDLRDAKDSSPASTPSGIPSNLGEADPIEALLHRVLVEGNPNHDDPFEVLLHRRLIEIAPHVYDSRAAHCLPDVYLTKMGEDQLNARTLEPRLLTYLQKLQDEEDAYYDGDNPEF